MSQHPSDIAFETPGTAPQKNWFGRNWKWFVPTIILVPLLCCCGGGGALMWFGLSQIKELPPYKDGLAIAQQDPNVTAALGSPIPQPGIFEIMQGGGTMDLNQYNAQIVFDATIPLNGPAGSGTLSILAESADGGATWSYSTLEVQVDSTGAVIDLNPDAGTDAEGEDAEAGEAADADADTSIDTAVEAIKALEESR